MELLKHSIEKDGYTQPIVAWTNSEVHDFEVIDGFHRHRVGKECDSVKERVIGYLPIVEIKEDNEGRNDRISSTIRHNRARGTHKVNSMSEIVVELKRRRWNDAKIAKELGMEKDEILRLSQVSGIAALFADKEFSNAWEADDIGDIEND